METLRYLESINTAKPGSYFILGDPIAQMRPRFGGGRVWNAQKAIQMTTQLALQIQHQDKPLFSGPLHVDLKFIFTPAQRAKPAQKAKIYNTYHIFKPDTDNLIKFALDVASSVLFHDDCIVASISATKSYGKEAITYITITQLENHVSDK